MGTKLRKYFNGHGVFDGKVVSRTKERGTDSDLYRILYEDGDSEDDGFNEHEDVKNFRYDLLGDSDLVPKFSQDKPGLFL